MKTKFTLTIACFLAMVSLINAQTLSEFKPTDQSYGVKKAKNAKRIYVSNFIVNYQVYNEKESFKQGGYQLGGGAKGDASAFASVGLEGLTEQTVQQITDKLYANYIGMLKNAGFEIITADEAAKTETYSDYVKMNGGKISLAQIPGTMTSAPTGYDYFVKSVNNDGKTKSGGFLNNPAFLWAKLSKELNDAIVSHVELSVLFVQDQSAWQGAGANIKIKTALRISGVESITMASDAKVKFKGQNDVINATSTIAFTHGKMGAGATTSYNGTQAKPLYINDVIEDQKIQSFARGGLDMVGTSTIYGTYFNKDNRSTSTTKIIPVNPDVYAAGVLMGANKFLEHHTKNFLDELK